MAHYTNVAIRYYEQKKNLHDLGKGTGKCLRKVSKTGYYIIHMRAIPAEEETSLKWYVKTPFL
jgi:hypothetical protein